MFLDSNDNEYCFWAQVKRTHFPQRNSISAAFSSALSVQLPLSSRQRNWTCQSDEDLELQEGEATTLSSPGPWEAHCSTLIPKQLLQVTTVIELILPFTLSQHYWHHYWSIWVSWDVFWKDLAKSYTEEWRKCKCQYSYPWSRHISPRPD